jgi:WhiB family redox-sensing transcriptional regulator
MPPIYGDVQWRFKGACVDDPDPDRWYSLAELNGQPGTDTTIRELRGICAACPVLAQCLEHALAHETWGIWAGTTPKERQRMRRQRGIVVREAA